MPQDAAVGSIAAADTGGGHSHVGLTISRGILIVPVQVELYDDVLYALKDHALQLIQKRALHGILLDLSHLKVMDREMAQQLSELLNMAQLLGAQGMVCGLQPGVVTAMIEWDQLWQGIDTSISLDAGLRLLQTNPC